MTKNRLDDAIRIAASAQDIRAGKWMLVSRRKHLVIKIVQQADQAPLINISVSAAITTRASAHRGFDGDRVFTQAIALCVLTQKFPGFFSSPHSFLESES